MKKFTPYFFLFAFSILPIADYLTNTGFLTSCYISCSAEEEQEKEDKSQKDKDVESVKIASTDTYDVGFFDSLPIRFMKNSTFLNQFISTVLTPPPTAI